MDSQEKPLSGKNILITGGAVRVGREISTALAQAGANLIVHYNSSDAAARQLENDLSHDGNHVHLLQADLNDPADARQLVHRAANLGDLYALINNAAIYEAHDFQGTTLDSWERTMNINLTAPFLLSQAFGESLGKEKEGRILNILDWRALRPGADHFAYTISKAGLAAMTKASAQALAPNITVNGIALGAILPPSTGKAEDNILSRVPAGRWAEMHELREAAQFLLAGPAYITGEILHLDGGRHLT